MLRSGFGLVLLLIYAGVCFELSISKEKVQELMDPERYPAFSMLGLFLRHNEEHNRELLVSEASPINCTDVSMSGDSDTGKYL